MIPKYSQTIAVIALLFQFLDNIFIYRYNSFIFRWDKGMRSISSDLYFILCLLKHLFHLIISILRILLIIEFISFAYLKDMLIKYNIIFCI